MYMTVKQVADLLNVNEQTIRIAIKNGTIRAWKISEAKKSRWRIHPAEVEAFISKMFERDKCTNN